MNDRERGPYTPSADDPILTFDAREEDDTRRGPFILIAAVGFIVLFGAVIWNFYSQGVREGGRESTPRVVADAEPYRTEAVDSGGAVTPDQDKEVYAAAADTAPQPVRIETVDRTEEPLISAARAATPAAAAASKAAPPAPKVVAQAEPATRPPTDLRPRATEPPPRPVPPAVQVPPPATKTVAAPTPTPAPVQKAAAPATKATPSTGGAFAVQLGAFGSRELAEGAWRRYSGTSAAFAGRSPTYQPVQRDGKTLYRLRTGGFASREAAQAFCAQATAAGAACIVAS